MKVSNIVGFILTGAMALPAMAADQMSKSLSISSTSATRKTGSGMDLSIPTGKRNQKDASLEKSMSMERPSRSENMDSKGQSSKTHNDQKMEGGIAGGGGHFCKSQAQLFLDNVSAAFDENPALMEKYPEWSSLREKYNPEKNPRFLIKIAKSPIQGCPNTENALACGRPQQNTIEIFCGENGWNSLDQKEKYKQIIHEMYWWSKLDDTNYFYSSKLINDIYENILNKQSLRQEFVRFGKGDITSAETMLNSIDHCEPMYKEAWKEVDGKLVCNPQSPYGTNTACHLRFRQRFSVILNKKFSYEIDSSEVGAKFSSYSTALVPVGTAFSESKCKSVVRREAFATDSLWWLKALDDVQKGIVSFLEEGPKKTLTCFVSYFSIAYDPSNGEVGQASFDRYRVTCPQ